MKFLMSALLAMLLFTTPSNAQDASFTKVHITFMELSKFPDSIWIGVESQDKANCYFGITVVGRGSDMSTKRQNVGALYSLILAAILSKRTISLSAYGCQADVVMIDPE